MPDLDSTNLAAWTKKNQAAQELLIETNPLIAAWNRYDEWVDPPRGPTGKEKGAGSFAGIDRAQFVAAIEAARRLSTRKPAIGALDIMLNRYADGIERVLPVAVEASGYYQRRDFLTDQMKGGIALHPRLVEDYRLFLETRADLSQTAQSLADRIEGRELALLEQREGKSPHWQQRNILRTARGVQAAVPHLPNSSAAALETFDRTVKELVDLVQALEATKDPGSGQFIKEANAYIGELRRIRREYGQSGATIMLDVWLTNLNLAFRRIAEAAREGR